MLIHLRPTNVWIVLAATWLSIAGCAKRPTEDAGGGAKASGTSKTVALVSERDSVSPRKGKALPAADLPFLAEYRKANAYSDQALLKLTHYLEDGRREESHTQIITQFVAPNRIRLRVSSEDNLVDIVSDGKQLAAKIVDPVTKNFDGQVVVRAVPGALAIANLYEVTELIDPIAPNEMLSALLGVPAGLDVLPFSLFLNEGKLTELASKQTPHASLGTMKLPSGESCEVIEADSAEGKYRFWIADNRLRRMEFPPLTENLLPGVRQMALIVELNDVSFAAAESDFAIHENGTKVRHFVLPPIPPATNQLGEEIPSMSFQNRNAEEVRVANDDGQITVLVWFRNRPESQMVLDSIEHVRRRNRSDRVRFAAVSAEPDATYDLLQKWNVETAWLQDRHAEGRERLGIDQAPTVLVLGPKNSVQYFEIGANPNVGADVAAVVQRLLAGQNVAAATRLLATETEQAYQQLLSRAKKVDDDVWVEELEQEVPVAEQPNRLALREIWSIKEIKEPGNFLIVPGKRKQILVTEGWKQLVMIGLDGKITRRIELEVPDEEGVSILRAGSNGRDRALIAAASRGGRQAYLFDFAGKQQTKYPAAPNPTTSISDLLVHDIDNDDNPELIVGWQGSGGVHGVGLDGKRHWANQATPGVISISPVKDESSGSERRPVLTAGESGLLFLVDEDGRTLREIRLDQVVHQLTTWPGNARGFETILKQDKDSPSSGEALHLGIASSALGGRVVSGIDQEWKALWSRSLPRGVYRHQVDFPQAVTIPEVGATWLVPGPDGSVHFFSADGKFQDVLMVGQHIRGIASVRIGDKPVLLLSTDEQVTALEIELAE